MLNFIFGSFFFSSFCSKREVGSFDTLSYENKSVKRLAAVSLVFVFFSAFFCESFVSRVSSFTMISNGISQKLGIL